MNKTGGIAYKEEEVVYKDFQIAEICRESYGKMVWLQRLKMFIMHKAHEDNMFLLRKPHVTPKLLVLHMNNASYLIHIRACLNFPVCATNYH